MKKLIKKVLREEVLLNEQPVQGAKVTAKICDPLPNEWTGPWNDQYFIKIYMQGTWVTPAVGMYMISKAVGPTGAHKGYDTSWEIIGIQSYGTVEGPREGYHKCVLDRPGCMDPTACNFKAHQQINVDDGSCVYPGCDDPIAANYNPNLPANCVCDDVLPNDGRPDCCQYPGCTIAGSVNYDPLANVNDGSCIAPTTYMCSDGQCSLHINGPHATLGECLVECSTCAHSECWYCPGPIQTKANQNDFIQQDLSEKVTTTNPTQGCKVAGSQWLQILTSGNYLYTTKDDCETAEPDCSSDDNTTPAETEACHCCKKNKDGTSTLTVMPGTVSVGNCNYHVTSNSSVNQGWVGVYSVCAPVTQSLVCEGHTTTSTLGFKKGENKGKDREKMTSDIKEDIRKMKKIIK